MVEREDFPDDLARRRVRKHAEAERAHKAAEDLRIHIACVVAAVCVVVIFVGLAVLGFIVWSRVRNGG